MKRDFEIFFDEEIKELGKLNLPDPDILSYYNRVQNRHVFWNDYVDDTMVDFSLLLMKWNKEDKGIPVDQRKEIKIYVNTDGGDLTSVLNFIDVISLSKTPIVTIGMGKIYSAGSLLMMAGHKRYIFPNTTCLIHSGSFGTMGTTDKVLDNLEFTQKQEKKVKEYIVNRTKITDKQYTKNYRKDWWLLSEEIIELVIADKIITDLDEVI